MNGRVLHHSLFRSDLKHSAAVQTRSRSDVGSGDWGNFSVPLAFEETHLDDKRPPKHLNMPREDWQALLRLARDQYQTGDALRKRGGPNS